MDYIEVLNNIDAAVWGPPMIILLLGCHIYTTIRTRGIQRKLPLALKLSVTKDNGAQGDVSNFGAMATSLGVYAGHRLHRGRGHGRAFRRPGRGAVDVADRVSWAWPRSIRKCTRP